MGETWWAKFRWWLCGKIGHPLPRKAWVYNGKYHKDCRWCGRIVSVSCKEKNT